MLKAPKKNYVQWKTTCWRACFAYANAIAKHPNFADILTDKSAEEAADALAYQREWLKTRIEKKNVRPLDVLAYEVAEIEEAMVNGRWDDAREEIFDAIAVLLRLDDAVRVAKEQIG